MTTPEGALLEIARIRASADALERFLVPAVAPAPERAEPPPEVVPAGLAKPGAFFDYVRARPPLGPALREDEVAGCTRLLEACAASRFPLSWAAYVLATSYHETAGTLRPIAEYGKGHGRPYGKPGRNRGQVAYGRGDVQLTWDDNYERMDAELGLDGALIANYELALDPAISSRVIVRGLEIGLFTGKSLADYLPERADLRQFSNCRRTVNGLDKAALIGGYAVTFQAGLDAGGWR